MNIKAQLLNTGMANDKISGFPSAAPTGGDYVPIVQGGASKKTTITDISNFSGGFKSRENWNGGSLVGATWTLASTPVGLLLVFKNGMLLTPGIDYGVSGAVITFSDPSVPSDVFSAIY